MLLVELEISIYLWHTTREDRRGVVEERDGGGVEMMNKMRRG